MSASMFDSLIAMLEQREKRQVAALDQTRRELEQARSAAGVPAQASLPARGIGK